MRRLYNFVLIAENAIQHLLIAASVRSTVGSPSWKEIKNNNNILNKIWIWISSREPDEEP